MSTNTIHPNKSGRRLELFTTRSAEEIEASIRDGRITSPVHWKYYYDLNPTSLEIETKLHEFIGLVEENQEDAVLWIKNLAL